MSNVASKSQAAVQALAIGLEASTAQMLEKVFAHCQVRTLPIDIEKLLEMEQATPPNFVVVGPPPEGVALIEVAQMLRMQFPALSIFYTTHVRAGFERKDFQKNGFTDAFLLPLDGLLMLRTLQDLVAKFSNGEIKSFRSVRLVDIQPGTVLNFDTTIYLPVNKKFIQYSESGYPLDSDQVDRLSKHQVKSLYVSAEQMPKFYEYSASRLKELSGSKTLSETERKERLENSVRDILSSVFTDPSKEGGFEAGQGLVKDCQEVVKSFILSSNPSEWYQRLMSLQGEMKGGGYSHSSNVSTFAALFSLGLGIGNPEELALAGLLHDIGMVELPFEIQQKSAKDMTRSEFDQFKKHPELSLNLMKARKMVVPEKVQKAILQHHEKFNGTGFPKGLAGDRILKEAQVLALANKFDELTAVSEGNPGMTPLEALQYLRKRTMDNPSDMEFDPELLKGILKLFPNEGSGS